eukprot:893970-Pleurochrysis_carterae.AAC.1
MWKCVDPVHAGATVQVGIHPSKCVITKLKVTTPLLLVSRNIGDCDAVSELLGCHAPFSIKFFSLSSRLQGLTSTFLSLIGCVPTRTSSAHVPRTICRRTRPPYSNFTPVPPTHPQSSLVLSLLLCSFLQLDKDRKNILERKNKEAKSAKGKGKFTEQDVAMADVD